MRTDSFSRIVREVPRGLHGDEPRVPAGPLQAERPAIRAPEPQAVAIVDPGDAVGREQELSQVLPAPAVGPARVMTETVQVDQGQPWGGLGRLVSISFIGLQEEM